MTVGNLPQPFLRLPFTKVTIVRFQRAHCLFRPRRSCLPRGLSGLHLGGQNKAEQLTQVFVGAHTSAELSQRRAIRRLEQRFLLQVGIALSRFGLCVAKQVLHFVKRATIVY